jgi:hypothetical protein
LSLAPYHRRAHNVENAGAKEYWNRGELGLRIPASGGGAFKGDVLGFKHHGVIELSLFRRSQHSSAIRFTRLEINVMIDQIRKLRGLEFNVAPLRLRAVFALNRTTYERVITDYVKEDVVFRCS